MQTKNVLILWRENSSTECLYFRTAYQISNYVRGQYFKIEPTSKGFQCPKQCGRRYKNYKSVLQHLKYECGVNKQFECHICNKQFSRRFSLKTHITLVHKILD